MGVRDAIKDKKNALLQVPWSMTKMGKIALVVLGIVGGIALAIAGGYWWTNVPPKRPSNVSSNAVFLWAGHLGLPAPKHGTWLECWADATNGVNKCKLTEMDGKPNYEGVFLANTGRTLVPQSDLKIKGEQTSQSFDLWVRIQQHFVPLIFLQDGTVLIPKGAYEEGMAKLNRLHHQAQGKEP